VCARLNQEIIIAAFILDFKKGLGADMKNGNWESPRVHKKYREFSCDPTALRLQK